MAMASEIFDNIQKGIINVSKEVRIDGIEFWYKVHIQNSGVKLGSENVYVSDVSDVEDGQKNKKRLNLKEACACQPVSN